MSVINQVLVDLEKRRATPAEFSAVADHVRALPDGERSVHWWWIAGAVAAATATAAIAWTMLARPAAQPVQPAKPVTQPVARL